MLFQNFASPAQVPFFLESDIVFSKRRDGMSIEAYDPRTLSNPQSSDTTRTILAMDAARDYNANRLVWHYPDNRDFIDAFQGQVSNPTPSNAANCAIHLFVTETQSQDLQCKDLWGRNLWAPWEGTFCNPNRTTGVCEKLVRGDTLKTSFIEYQKEKVRVIMGKNCRSLQQDSPYQNIEVLGYGGCFSDEADGKFRAYLRDNYSTQELVRKGITNIDTFSYSQHLQAENPARPVSFVDFRSDLAVRDPLNLKYDYEQLNLKNLKIYYDGLRAAAKASADNTTIPMSGNVFLDQDYAAIGNFDFALMEAPSAYKNIYGVIEKAAASVKVGKKVIDTLPAHDLKLNRTAFATTYALGMQMILPFDVYTPDGPNGATSRRYTENRSEFKDLTDFITNNKGYFDNFAGLEVYGQKNYSEITAVIELAKSVGFPNGRLAVHHTGSNQLKSIAAGAVATINGVAYPVICPTIGGIIYIDVSAKAALTNAVRDKWPVQRIVNPNGTGRLFQVKLSVLAPQVTAIEQSGDTSKITFTRKSTSLEIEAGATVKFGNNRAFVTSLANNNFESPEFAFAQFPARGTSIALGDQIIQIVNPTKLSRDFQLPNINAPRVGHLDYNLTSPGRTAVRLSYPEGTVGPLNTFVETRLKFGLTPFESITVSSSVAGNYYFAGDQRRSIFLRQPVLEIQVPNGPLQNFAAPLINPANDRVLITQGVSDYLVAVKTHKTQPSRRILHIVNWKDSPIPAALTMYAPQILGGIRTSCRFIAADQAVPRTIVPVDRGNGWYRLDYPPVKTWAIIDCN